MKQTDTDTLCFMNDELQSALSDEHLYHSSLVNRAMKTSPKTVCIFGGGEGATAREVLKWDCVKSAKMIDWDKEVVGMFKERYPEWGMGVWYDPRLTIRYKDAFSYCRQWQKFDTIIVDLFDPSNIGEWITFLDNISRWVQKSIAIYVGTTHRLDMPISKTVESSLQTLRKNDIYSSYYCKFIPSFEEYAVFVVGFKGS